MKDFLNKTFVIDGSYCLHRALNQPKLKEFTTSEGILSGGVYGTLRIIIAECRKFPGYYPIVCWDAGLSSRRTEIYPDYKHNLDRQASIAAGEMDPYIEEYRRQRGDLIQILRELGIPSLRIYGWEGDDLMYILTRMSRESVVLSDDKDLIQLVSPTCRVDRAMKGEVLDYQNTDASYRHPHYCIAKAIVGDPSDNIPKVAPGVGGKGAQAIAAYLAQLPRDNWKDSLEIYDGKAAKKFKAVADNIDQLYTNFDLTDLTQVEVPDDIYEVIESSIRPVLGKSNFFKAMEWMSKYEITSINIQQALSVILPYAKDVFVDGGNN